jgi:hypothetical protein
MKSLKTWSKLQESIDLDKQVKKIEKSVGGGVSAAGVFESWVFIVARLSGSTTRPKISDINTALGDGEFHNKGAKWFNKIGWSSQKDVDGVLKTNGGEGFPVEWIIDSIEMVGADVKTIKEIKNWGSLEIIHEKLGPNYYDITSDRWKEGAGKQNTADIVFITKGDAKGLSNALKADVDLKWDDTVKGKISTKDGNVEWFQVSLKKGIDDARIGKIGDFLRMKYAKDGYSAQIDDMPTHQMLLPYNPEQESILKARGDFLGVSYGFDDRIDQILLDEGLFDAFKGIVNKIKGSIKKLVDWASGKLRKLVGGAVKLASKVMHSNPVLTNVNSILAMGGVTAKMLGEEYLVEKEINPIKLTDGERTGIIKRFKAFEKQLSSGMVNKEYDKIKSNIDALNAHKAEKFPAGRDAVKLLTTDAAAKLDEAKFAILTRKIIEKLENDDWKKVLPNKKGERDTGLTSKDFFLLLKVASHYTAYNAINVILKNLLKNIKTHQHVVDAAKTFVADVKTEAKFGKTLLPLWIVYGHNGGSHYLATKSAFHSQSEADIQKVADDLNLDQPYIVIQITPSKKTAATYGLEGHNVTQLYLMSGLKEVGDNEFKTKYLLLNFTTSSGSSFTMKPEVEKELVKEWK